MPLTLERITARNLDAVLGLKMREGQEEFCPNNAYSLAQASVTSGTYRRLIVLEGGRPVGFVMLHVADVKKDGSIFLWRFMIDGALQGTGLGKEAFALVLKRIKRSWPSATVLKSCFVPGEKGPEKFWLAQGFTIDGPEVDGEVPMSMQLKESK